MLLIAIGGDLRTNGLLRAAQQEGIACEHVKSKEELCALERHAEAIVLPWPRCFSGAEVQGTDIDETTLLEHIPTCDYLMGGVLDRQDFPRAGVLVDPSKDEAFLTLNAKLTAEGTVAALLNANRDALLGKTCLITGFGRIARALAARLAAMEMFVIVCARNEEQMRLAHRLGAHPAVLQQLSAVSAQADIVINTVPSRIFGSDALAQMKPGARFIELASAPYGADPEQAAHLGVSMEIMGGIPGKYAPQRAGEALFDVLLRAMKADSQAKEAQ